jgi:hypothetical protein
MGDLLTVETLARFLSVVMAIALVFIVVSQSLAIWRDRCTIWKSLLGADGAEKLSLARFQFLLCLMVLLPLFLVLSLETGQFIEIPIGVQVLFGISAAAYVLGKAIDAARRPPRDSKSGS